MTSNSSTLIEKKLIEYFLGFLGQIKIYHWSTMCYSTHKALDDLHESLSDNIDEIMEVYIGKFNKQPLERFEINMKANSITDNIIEYLELEREKIRGIRNKYFKSSTEIQNLFDNMLGNISRTIYLCKLK
jgi:DNA-binding ferritin-like protein